MLKSYSKISITHSHRHAYTKVNIAHTFVLFCFEFIKINNNNTHEKKETKEFKWITMELIVRTTAAVATISPLWICRLGMF